MTVMSSPADNRTASRFLARFFLLLIISPCFLCQVGDGGAAGEDDVTKTTTEKQAPLAESYGTEVSWPMQRAVEEKDQQTAAMTQSQRDAYETYMKGCSETYTPELCQQNEADRIAINAAQPSQLRNFTAAGYAKVQAPAKSFRLLKEFWEKHSAENLLTERWEAANTHVNHWAVPTLTLRVDAPDGPTLKNRRRIVEEVQNILEQWSGGVPLVPTSMYGIRVYQNGAILALHVDRYVYKCVV